MDVLTRIIELAQMTADLEVRCRLGGSYRIGHDVAASGSLPFHIVLGGDCIIETEDGSRFTMKSGDFLLLSRGQRHAIVGLRPSQNNAVIDVRDGDFLPIKSTPAAIEEVDLLCGQFRYTQGASHLLIRSLPDVLHVSLVQDQPEAALTTLLAILRAETILERPGGLLVMKALSIMLFTMALRIGLDRRDGENIVSLLADERLGRAIRHVIGDPGRSWRLDKVAELAHMSRSTFARRFTATSGVPFATFLADLRMSIASEHLTSTTRSVAEIASGVGYLSEAAFAKVFKQYVGTSPSKHRKEAALVRELPK